MMASGLALMLFLSGCIVRRTPVPQNQRLLPAQTRSFAEIVQLLAERSQAIKSLKAVRVVFQPSAGARKKNEVMELRALDGYLLVNRPNDIHIHLSVPLLKTTLADMVSDGTEYKVWSPLNNNFYVGNADQPIQLENWISSCRRRRTSPAPYSWTYRPISTIRASTSCFKPKPSRDSTATTSCGLWISREVD